MLIRVVVVQVFISFVYFNIPAYAQQGTLNGMLVDASHIPIPNVTIGYKQNYEKDYSYTNSDEQGKFQIENLQEDAKYDFQFTHINYKTHSITAFEIKGKNNSLLVKMQAVEKGLEEVIITSLGIAREKSD